MDIDRAEFNGPGWGARLWGVNMSGSDLFVVLALIGIVVVAVVAILAR